MHPCCLKCIKPLGQLEVDALDDASNLPVRLEVGCKDWKCPFFQTPQTVIPEDTSRNYALEQVLQSSSLKTEQEKIDRAKYKLNILIEKIRTELTDQELKINELIEKKPGAIYRKYINTRFLVPTLNT